MKRILENNSLKCFNYDKNFFIFQAEIDARESNFGDCISLGKELLSRNHYASNEIKDKLMELSNMRNEMLHRWEERWEHLQLILEVYQFARDAAVAEAWLMAQDPYLKSEELGVRGFSIFCTVDFFLDFCFEKENMSRQNYNAEK